MRPWFFTGAVLPVYKWFLVCSVMHGLPPFFWINIYISAVFYIKFSQDLSSLAFGCIIP
jgi:hypothetical protein